MEHFSTLCSAEKAKANVPNVVQKPNPTGDSVTSAVDNYNYVKKVNDMETKKNGILDIDDLVTSQPTFKKIMEDSIVTDEELKEQSQCVITLTKQIEDRLPDEELQLVKRLLAEMSVMTTVYHYYQLQNIR